MAVTEVHSSFVPTVLQAVEDFTEKQDYGVLLMSTRNDLRREEQVLEFMLARNVDGIIVRSISGLSTRMKTLLAERQVPVVYLCQSPANGLPGAGSVCGDAFQIGYLGAGHLLERGHRHIACVGMMAEIRPGIAAAASGTAGQVIEYWPMPDLPGTGEAIVTRWMNAPVRPTAMFIAGDEVACLAMNAALQQGIRIPQDLALVGIDDIPIAAQAAVPLTTVSQPKYDQGQAAARVLFDLMEGKPAQNLVFAPTLVRRRTT
jgi:LacI family transcriptional regulator